MVEVGGAACIQESEARSQNVQAHSDSWLLRLHQQHDRQRPERVDRRLQHAIAQVQPSRGAAVEVQRAIHIQVALAKPVGQAAQREVAGGADQQQQAPGAVDRHGAAAGAASVVFDRGRRAAGEHQHWEGLQRLFDRFSWVVGLIAQRLQRHPAIRRDGQHAAEAGVACAAGAAIADEQRGSLIFRREEAAIERRQWPALFEPAA